MKELIKFKDVIKLIMGFMDSIKDSIEKKNKFGGLIWINLQKLKD